MTDYRILVTCWIGCSLLLSCNGTHEPAKAPTPAADSASQGAPSLNLIGSEWLLEDLGGSGVLDRVQATLAFQEAERSPEEGLAIVSLDRR